MSDIIQYYYPEGPYGPICDYVAPDTTLRCRIDSDCPAGYVCVNGVCVPRLNLLADDAADTEVLFDPPDNDYAYWPKVTCKKNPETGELYDCLPTWDKPLPSNDIFNDITREWDQTNVQDFGIYDKFFVVEIGPQTCQPYDPDINIRPITFVDNDGVKTIKQAVEKSTPVTYPVTADYQTVEGGALVVKFSDDGNKLITTGRGSGYVTITVSWDDDPSSNGVAFDSITINGVTWTRSGNTGISTENVPVESNTEYTITYVNLNSRNNPITVTDSNRKLNLKDDDGDDANATVEITDIYSPIQDDTSKGSLWNSTADQYGVWVNPAECTLPCAEQEVTYLINFPETDTYYFECGADDNGNFFLDDETLPFASPTTPTMLNPDTFTQATGPILISRTITAGNHKVVVRVTNGPSGGDSYEDFYIDSSVDWGTVTLGSGTAIRNSEEGIAPDNPASGLNELGGFTVPSDSTTGKYLSFGTLDLTNTPVYTRTASVTMDLSNTSRIIFTVIAGSDSNGGERPNDITDTWDVSFDGGSSWIQVAPSKQYSGMEFEEYDATYGDWYDFAVNIPESARTTNFTIYFRSGGDVPEIGTNYNGLTPTQVETTYGNCGDVYGLYRIRKVTNEDGTCLNIHQNAYDWDKNPGGWYIKICKSAPCAVAQSIDWYPVTLGSTWSSVMNNYAVWPSQTQNLSGTPQTATYFITVINSDTYTLKYSADNEIEIYWDGNQVAQLTGDVFSHYNTIHTVSLPNVSSGQHTLKMNVNNVPNSSNSGSWSDNPAGAAWTLEDSSGNIIATSRDLVTSGDGNLIWHTRLATGYKYEEN